MTGFLTRYAPQSLRTLVCISGFRWVSGMENEDRIYIDVGHLQVGALKPGCFKIGNTGGMLDNILTSKLYRPGR